MTGTVKKDVSPMNLVLAVLAAGALLLSASGSALAGGSVGGASGGADEFALSGLEDPPDSLDHVSSLNSATGEA